MYEFRDPTRFGFNEFINQTSIHPLALGMLLLACALLLALPRRQAMWPMVVLLCFVAAGQRIVIGGVDFSFIRIVGIVGFMRVAIRGEYRQVRWNTIDALILVFACWAPVATAARGQSGVVMAELGRALEIVLMYLLGRTLIRTIPDLVNLATALAVVSIPVLVAFAIENRTGHNSFSVFGGVPETTPIREGKLRCQGAFAHPILAGTWWACVAPLLWTIGWVLRARVRGLLLLTSGVLVCPVLVFLSASSTPMGVLVGAAMLMLGYPLRHRLRGIWIAAVLAGILLHAITKNGLHHIIFARFAFVTGSTGYHRYRLVDACLNRITEWFALGTNSTYHWGWGLDDVTCEYVYAAVRGGAILLGALVAALFLSFLSVGRALRSAPARRPDVSLVIYGLGVTIAAHAIAFLGVTYFGQIYFLLYSTLGMVVSVTTDVVSAVARPGPSTSQARSQHAPIPALDRAVNIATIAPSQCALRQINP